MSAWSPGGRLVIADMMFGRGGSRRGRAILRQKVAALAAKGVGGWWHIAKGDRSTAPGSAGSGNFAWTRQVREAGIQS